MFQIRDIFQDSTDISPFFFKLPGLPDRCSMRLIFRAFVFVFCFKNQPHKRSGHHPGIVSGPIDAKNKVQLLYSIIRFITKINEMGNKKIQYDLSIK